MDERLDETTVAGSVLRSHPSPTRPITDRVFGDCIVLYGDRVCRTIIPASRCEAREYGSYTTKQQAQNEGGKLDDEGGGIIKNHRAGRWENETNNIMDK